MAKKGEMEKPQYFCPSADQQRGCCKVESVISIDERGQMVLPKEIRDKARISAGDKLAVISWERNGEVCCVSLIKVQGFSQMINSLLGPMMQEILAK